MNHRNELSKSLGSPDISKSIHLFRLQEKTYNRLLEQRSEVKATSDKKKYKEVQEEIQDLSRAIKDSTNTLTRNLKENPTISSNMTKVSRDRTDLTDLLLRCTQELRDHRTFRTIVSKVEEEHRTRSRLQDLKVTEKSLRDTVFKLQQQLIDEQNDLANEIQNKRAQIAQLRAEIHSIKTSASINSNFKRKESHAQVAATWREYKLKQRELEIKIKDYESQLKMEDIVCIETKEFLTRKINSLGQDLKMWEIKYDKDIGDMDDTIKKVTHDRNKLLEKLTHLQGRRHEEIQLKEEEAAQEIVQKSVNLTNTSSLMRQNIAARKIQNIMKIYLKHLKFLAANKPAKKKKEGGKDKDGKKKKK